jgi:hypothetical protein
LWSIGGGPARSHFGLRRRSAQRLSSSKTVLDLRFDLFSAGLQEYVGSGPMYSETSFTPVESTK